MKASEMARKPKKADPVVEKTVILWRWHSQSDGERRVWNSNWPGDMFEIVDKAAFESFEAACGKLGIEIREANEDE